MKQKVLNFQFIQSFKKLTLEFLVVYHHSYLEMIDIRSYRFQKSFIDVDNVFESRYSINFSNL